MAVGGTRLHCERCQTETVCRAVSPTRMGKKKEQRVDHAAYDDLHWFRRGRTCLACGREFLTGELDEPFIEELADLRKAWLAKIRTSASTMRQSCEAKSRRETVPLEDAQEFVRQTAYWDHPKAYSYVRAPRHAERVYMHSLGWAVDFGENTFLPGLAICRCNSAMAQVFRELEDGSVRFREDAIGRLRSAISGSVANGDGQEYAGCYPMDGPYLRFGNQLINANRGALFILRRTDPDGILMARASPSA